MVSSAPNARPSAATSQERNILHDGRKRQKLSHSPEKESQPLRIGDGVRRVPSQESGSSDQSGSKWFTAANQNLDAGPTRQSELDDDPPFYMSNHPNYVPTNFIASEDGRLFGGQSRLDSENEDLRGVIDDLTVENKRLKHIIRQQQRRSRDSPSEASQQQQDKLFEVRMHGLPPEKRRELEYLLKNFATSVHTSVPSKTTPTSNTSASATSSGQNGKRGEPRTDSGYASNTTSGATTALVGAGPPRSRTATNQAVKNYLQEIPPGLLPKHGPIMSERVKQALVVRKLEQLFTGRRAAPGEHKHPLQQQEISHSAARADRVNDAKNNRKRKAEGSREAHVMPPESRVNLDAVDQLEPRETSLSRVRKDHDAIAGSPPGSPDQRPTRPLDLDIDRAQAAAENIQYIRHLGLSSPELGGTLPEGEENPWMFLNLLASLAQLHTLNVTPDFIRTAIKKRSSRFEVSKDGVKVRWVGGEEATRFAAEDEKALEMADTSLHESTEEPGTGGSSSNRSKTDSTSYLAVTSHTPSEEPTSGLHSSSDSKRPQPTRSGTLNMPSTALPTKTTLPSSAFDYRPIVYRENPRSVYEEYRDSDESFDSQSGDSSGLVHALSRSNLNQKGKEEGLITFYNNPYFCSDFSAEQEPSNKLPPRLAVPGDTLGLPALPDLCESPLRHHDATYFTMQFAPQPWVPEALTEQDKARFTASLPSLPELSPILEAGVHEPCPQELEACGLGGVMPEDSFALDVQVRRTPAPPRGGGVAVRQLPFSRRRYLPRYVSEVTSCKKIELLPSKLPPPSYIFFTSSSSSDGDDEDGASESSDSSSSPFVDEEYPAPPAFLRQFSGSSAENLGDDEADDMDSSEIDMLAIARQVNPHHIAEQERVYMISQPGGMQRAVAGSLAATVGASMSEPSMHEALPGPSSVSTRSVRSPNEDVDSDADMDQPRPV